MLVVQERRDSFVRIRLGGNNRERGKYEHGLGGVSSRLDNLQAAILRVKLRHLEGWNEGRRRLAKIYAQELDGISGLRLPREAPDCRAVYNQFTIRTARRDALRSQLEEKGIATAIHYPLPLHRQPAYAHLGSKEGSFPNAEKAAREVP